MRKLLLFIAGLIVVVVVVVGIVKTAQSFFRAPLLKQPEVGSTLVSEVQSKPKDYLVYGFLPYWTVTTAQISPALTHVAYFSVPITADGKLLSGDSKELGLRRLIQGALSGIKEKTNDRQTVEVTLTMLEQQSIPDFFSDPQAQERYKEELATLLVTYPEIGGINIDVEYNGIVDSTLKAQFIQFVETTSMLAKKHSPSMHISIATYADAADIERLTDIKAIAPFVDHIIIMAYDYHRRSSLHAGPVAPLYGSAKGFWDADLMLNLKQYSDKVPTSKILLGIPFYGYEWEVVDTTDRAFTVPQTGATATYQRVKNLIASGTVEAFWDDAAFSPYIRYTQNGNPKVIYFENSQSLEYKFQLVKQAGLGGIAIWALGYEGNSQELWDTIENSLHPNQ